MFGRFSFQVIVSLDREGLDLRDEVVKDRQTNQLERQLVVNDGQKRIAFLALTARQKHAESGHRTMSNKCQRTTSSRPQKNLKDVKPTAKELQNSMKYLQSLDKKKKLSKSRMINNQQSTQGIE